MRTTQIPYNRKIGLNLSNEFFKFIDDKKISYLDLFFRKNEREGIGRRILITIYLLEGYENSQILNKTKCGKQTLFSIRSELARYKGDYDKLLKDLRVIYYNQFPKNQRTYGTRTVAGTKQMFGIGVVQDKDKRVEI